MSRTSFREFMQMLDEASHCDGIKDPVIRKACKNLQKKSYKVRMYGGIGPGVGHGGAPGNGGGGACPGGGSGGSGGGAGAGGGAGGGGGGM